MVMVNVLEHIEDDAPPRRLFTAVEQGENFDFYLRYRFFIANWTGSMTTSAATGARIWSCRKCGSDPKLRPSDITYFPGGY